MRTFDILVEELKINGGVKTYVMEDLFVIHGTSKPDAQVLQEIMNSLDRRAIEFYPELSTRPESRVRLYLKDSPIGTVYDAVLHCSIEGDVLLRAWSNTTHREKQIQTIKQLVEKL